MIGSIQCFYGIGSILGCEVPGESSGERSGDPLGEEAARGLRSTGRTVCEGCAKDVRTGVRRDFLDLLRPDS